MNLARSQAHCSSANEIKATFAFLPLSIIFLEGQLGRSALMRRVKRKKKLEEMGYSQKLGRVLRIKVSASHLGNYFTLKHKVDFIELLYLNLSF